MKTVIFVVLLVLGTAGCKKGGVCVGSKDTIRGPEKVCEYGISFDMDEASCSSWNATFHPYTGEGKTTKERGEATCRVSGLGARPEGH